MSRGRLADRRNGASFARTTSPITVERHTCLPALPKRRSSKTLAAKRIPSNVVGAVCPQNTDAERAKFFEESSGRYEPQFSYTLPQPLLELTMRQASCGRAQVQDKYVPHALTILNTLLRQYGSYEQYFDKVAGDLLDEGEARQIVGDYLGEIGADKHVVVHFNPTMVGQASFEKKASRLSIRPQGLRRHLLSGTLHHEIGTHYLRERNDRKQAWAKEVNGRRKYMLEDKNPTEEGLASLHTVMEREGHMLWRAALLYYTVWRALQLSFRELYDDLAQFLGDNLDERWDYCVRVKRGLLDTSQPGGFAKDQMYLAGAMDILERRHRINFSALYIGKLSVQDAHRMKATGLARTDCLKLPMFLRGSERMARYRAVLDETVRCNGLTDLIDGAANKQAGTMTLT